MKKGQLLKMPVKHGEGCYYADPQTLDRLQKNRQILLRYVDAKGKADASGQSERLGGQYRRHLQ